MITIEHLREAWMFALFEINAAIFHLESGEGYEVTRSGEDPKQAADAWLENLRRDQTAYSAPLADFPSVP